jgi:hypothetical protein
MIMRLRHANIRLINRRSNLPRLLLALSSINGQCNDNSKNNPTDAQGLTGHSISVLDSPPNEKQPQVLRLRLAQKRAKLRSG